MTSQEARQQVDSCERQITGTYSTLLDAAKSMGSSAAQAASSKTTKSTFLPLIISLVGLLFCSSSTVFGILLIIAGIVIAYNTRQSAASVQKKVEQQVQYLNNALNSNSTRI